MALHKPFDRHFFLIGGSVKTSGGSLGLHKGQVGIFNMDRVGKDGPKAVSSFAGLPESTKLEIKMGRGDVVPGRTTNLKSFSSFPFTVNDVKKISVNTPSVTEPKVDEVIVGYNGIDNGTTLKFEKGNRYKMTIRLSGEPIGYLGYKHAQVDIPVYIDVEHCSPYAKLCDHCDPCGKLNCMPIVEYAVEKIKNFPLRGGVKAGHFIDAFPIIECNEDIPVGEETEYTFYELNTCDTGDGTALALVRAQYPELKIERVDRLGAMSVYQTLIEKEKGAPDAFVLGMPSLIKGCEDCPEGYTESKAGLVYAVSLEDNGEDKKDSVEALANAVAGTAVKSEGQKDGVGFYTVLLEKKLTDEELEAFVKDNPTATVHFVAKASALCSTDKTVEVEWVEGETCKATTMEYVLDVPDDECGENRLADVQAAYPDLEIELEGTTGGCQTRYKTKTITNMVCEECDPIFKDTYRSEAPENFEGHAWKPVQRNDDLEGCRCGIRLKGKPVVVNPGECIDDEIAYTNTSTRISVSGGYITEVRFGETQVDEPFHVEYLSRAVDVANIGANLREWEDRSYRYFTGTTRSKGRVERALKGDDRHVNPNAFYIDYVMQIRRNPYFSQWFSDQENETINYHFMVEVGMEKAVEDLLNKVAVAAGLPPVAAYGK